MDQPGRDNLRSIVTRRSCERFHRRGGQRRRCQPYSLAHRQHPRALTRPRRRRCKVDRQPAAAAFAAALGAAALSPAAADIVTEGLVQDLDAERGVATDGATVTGWANQVVGAGDDLGPGAGNPTLLEGVANGLAAVSLDGASRLVGDDGAPSTAWSTAAGSPGSRWSTPRLTPARRTRSSAP